MPFCYECGISYTGTSDKHEQKCNSGVLVFSNESRYSLGLKEFCHKHGIRHRELNLEDVWVRDYL
ncbi:hypothetical protein [Francisella adeliensis]|uniref:Uncharacterized protein n=1 Tax=Francisella adeliensis TaxID=2007306 RepID=A0A2Z4Y0Y4_9GAMM|nr:hypothetical protein [Francisella adeliensis]AXA34566.1 hypothetical protein CDH04_09240 [Francisella adeliensis]MBK2086290.1 hypothetical protein [Francisella adeliensis]QIW12812.1 hypothetical protein FZC43_09255 [Francisella adeliensis]